MTYEEACDVILSVFHNAWKPTGFPIVWNDIDSKPPTTQTPWARATIKHTSGGQGSLADENGAKLWDRGGVFFVQIFTPFEQGEQTGRRIGQSIVDAYNDYNGSVWFRRAHLRERPRDGAFLMLLFSVEFEYTEVR